MFTACTCIYVAILCKSGRTWIMQDIKYFISFNIYMYIVHAVFSLAQSEHVGLMLVSTRSRPYFLQSAEHCPLQYLLLRIQKYSVLWHLQENNYLKCLKTEDCSSHRVCKGEILVRIIFRKYVFLKIFFNNIFFVCKNLFQWNFMICLAYNFYPWPNGKF